MGEVGAVHETANGFEWKICSFFRVLEENPLYFYSPCFSYNGELWFLYGSKNFDSDSEFIRLGFCKQSCYSDDNFSMEFELSLAVKTVNGQKDLQRNISKVFEWRSSAHEYVRFVSISELKSRKNELVPSDILTVVCTLKTLKSIGNSCDSTTANCSYCKESLGTEFISLQLHQKCLNVAVRCSCCFENILLQNLLHDHKCEKKRTEECSYCKKNVHSENILKHEKKCMNRPIKCPECAEVILLQKWYDHQCQVTRAEGVDSLCQIFNKTLLEGHEYDLILKTDDKEFRIHEEVLRAQSRIFKSILSEDVVQKNCGIINTTDCDLRAMELFLSYVYFGNVESIDESDAHGLYYIALKYEMKGLKELCLKFIKTSLSISNFCQITQLALKHSDTDLLDFVTEYFMNNMLDILRTVEWQSFMKDNSTAANELIIKSCEKKK